MYQLKTLIYLFLTISFMSTSVIAQDVIVKIDGSEIQSKIIEVNTRNVKYKKHSNPEGVLYIINVSDVYQIIYEHGDTETYSDPKFIVTEDGLRVFPRDLYKKLNSVQANFSAGWLPTMPTLSYFICYERLLINNNYFKFGLKGGYGSVFYDYYGHDITKSSAFTAKSVFLFGNGKHFFESSYGYRLNMIEYLPEWGVDNKTYNTFSANKSYRYQCESGLLFKLNFELEYLSFPGRYLAYPSLTVGYSF